MNFSMDIDFEPKIIVCFLVNLLFLSTLMWYVAPKIPGFLTIFVACLAVIELIYAPLYLKWYILDKWFPDKDDEDNT